MFVANFGNESVSVISDTNNSVVATVGVGDGPVGLAYDSSKGEVFVVNDVSNGVYVISDATDYVVDVVSAGLGIDPISVAYDPSGEIFLADSGSDTLSVISDTPNATMANIVTGAGSFAVAFDASTNQVFVSNVDGGTVSVIEPPPLPAASSALPARHPGPGRPSPQAGWATPPRLPSSSST